MFTTKRYNTCVCVCVFTSQQSAHWKVDGYFVLRHLVSEGLHTVSSQTQADWLFTVRKTALALTERAQTLLVGLDQHVLLSNSII